MEAFGRPRVRGVGPHHRLAQKFQRLRPPRCPALQFRAIRGDLISAIGIEERDPVRKLFVIEEPRGLQDDTLHGRNVVVESPSSCDLRCGTCGRAVGCACGPAHQALPLLIVGGKLASSVGFKFSSRARML